MEPKCGITEISIVGCEIKILLRERDLLMLTGGMRGDDSSMQDEKTENHSLWPRTTALTRPI